MSKKLKISKAPKVQKSKKVQIVESQKDYQPKIEKQDVKIENRKLSEQEINDFIRYVKSEKEKNKDVQISLVDYVSNKFYSERHDIQVIPDLSGAIIGAKVKIEGIKSLDELHTIRENYTDLSGVDFTGSNMAGMKFISCNLDKAEFRDSDLTNVVFDDCYMAGSDLRGANISSCKFQGEPSFDDFSQDLKPEETIQIKQDNNKERYSEMKLSIVETLLHKYKAENDLALENAKENFEKNKQKLLSEKRDELDKAKEEVNEKFKNLGWFEWLNLSNKQYTSLLAKQGGIEGEIEKINSTSFEKDFDKSKLGYVVDPSVLETLLIMAGTNELRFYPTYNPNSSKEEKEQEVLYVKLTREDAESYLELLKKDPNLSINEFAEMQAKNKNTQVALGTRVIADFSNVVRDEEGASYEGEQVDLSGFNFSGANLSGGCFAGANMNGCDFTDANISFATFEGTELEDAKFTKTNAVYTNLIQAKMKNTVFEDANFSHSSMRNSDATGAKTKNSKFNFSDISNSIWKNVKFDTSDFSYVNFGQTLFNNSSIQKSKLLHTNLEDSTLKECEFIKNDLTGAFLIKADAQKLKIIDSILEDVDGRKINFTEGEIDELSKFKDADFEEAKMQRMKADGVNFSGANMKKVDASGSSMKNANLRYVDFSFSKLEGAFIDGAKANGLDLNGSDLGKLSAKQTHLENANLQNATGEEPDFSEAIMNEAKLNNASLKKAKFRETNLKKADLRGTNMEEVNLSRAKIEKATIDPATNFLRVKGTPKGKFKHENNDNKMKSMSFREKVKRDQDAEHVKNKGAFVPNRVFDGVQNGLNKLANFAEQPVSTKWGIVIGAVIGAVVVGGIAASAVFTGGGSLVVIAAIIAGGIAIGAACGGAAGWYGAKYMGLPTFVTTFAGWFTAGPIGAFLGAVLGSGGNKVVEEVTGKKFEEHGAAVVRDVGEVVALGKKYAGVTKEAEQAFHEKEECKKKYDTQKTGSKEQKQDKNKQSFHEVRDEALKATKPSYKKLNPKQAGVEEPTKKTPREEAKDIGVQVKTHRASLIGEVSPVSPSANPPEVGEKKRSASAIGEKLRSSSLITPESGVIPTETKPEDVAKSKQVTTEKKPKDVKKNKKAMKRQNLVNREVGLPK